MCLISAIGSSTLGLAIRKTQIMASPRKCFKESIRVQTSPVSLHVEAALVPTRRSRSAEDQYTTNSTQEHKAALISNAPSSERKLNFPLV